MNIYIAASLRERQRAIGLRDALRSRGHASTSSWMDTDDVSEDGYSPDRCARIASRCETEIARSDALVALLSDGVRGLLVEVGIARGLGMEIICVGTFARPSLMLALPGVRWVEHDALVAEELTRVWSTVPLPT